MLVIASDADITPSEREVAVIQRHPHFTGIARLHTSCQRVEQCDTISVEYTVAREDYLREPISAGQGHPYLRPLLARIGSEHEKDCIAEIYLYFTRLPREARRRKAV